ncbi:hypothetical protein [Hyphococcus luteus]|uniref:hypothetical protein n=1 Tax=Hyphococcus luteus TaxID=2058213 RepID=UPI0010571ECD|nr:hypothetical protein [Marinicaulis flavus]
MRLISSFSISCIFSIFCSTLLSACGDERVPKRECETPEIWRIEMGSSSIRIPQSYEPSFQGGNASEFRAKTESDRHFDYVYCQSTTDEPINPRLIQVSGDLDDFGWKTETENRVDELGLTDAHAVGVKLQLLSAEKVKFLDLDDDGTRPDSAAGRFADTYNRLSAIVGDVDASLKSSEPSETQAFDIVKVANAQNRTTLYYVSRSLRTTSGAPLTFECSDIGVCEYTARFDKDIVSSVQLSIRFGESMQDPARSKMFEQSLIEIYESINGWLDQIT